MPITPELLKAYTEAFLPYAASAAERIHAMGCRFAYYTTASTAIQVLTNREIWMRNTMVMNDFSEVEHGLRCVIKAYGSDAGKALKEVLDREYPGLSEEVEALFNSWIPGFRRDTFVACLSEHSPDEDRYGRLSMWRAYGGDAGIAIVVKGEVLFQPTNALAAYSSPVAYLDEDALVSELGQVASGLSGRLETLRQLGREGTKTAVFHMLRYAAVCTKHPAFTEEREWRVVSSPSMERSPFVPLTVETIGGIPQRVLKLKLADRPDLGLNGLEPNLLIDRVLIGPCEHDEVIGQALWQALEAAGVEDLGRKIVYTGIPLRPNQR